MDRITLTNIAAELLQDKKKIQIKASGCSMLPLFREGDEFIIEQPDNANLRKGDILIYLKENKLIVHRLHSILPNNKLLLWGDFNRQPDLPIEKSEIIAKATHFIRDKKTIKLDQLRFKIYGKCIITAAPLSNNILFYSVIAVQKAKKTISKLL